MGRLRRRSGGWHGHLARVGVHRSDLHLPRIPGPAAWPVWWNASCTGKLGNAYLQTVCWAVDEDRTSRVSGSRRGHRMVLQTRWSHSPATAKSSVDPQRIRVFEVLNDHKEHEGSASLQCPDTEQALANQPSTSGEVRG